METTDPQKYISEMDNSKLLYKIKTVIIRHDILAKINMLNLNERTITNRSRTSNRRSYSNFIEILKDIVQKYNDLLILDTRYNNIDWVYRQLQNPRFFGLNVSDLTKHQVKEVIEDILTDAIPEQKKYNELKQSLKSLFDSRVYIPKSIKKILIQKLLSDKDVSEEDDEWTAEIEGGKLYRKKRSHKSRKCKSKKCHKTSKRKTTHYL